MNCIRAVLLVVPGILASSACLTSQTTHVLYLSPSGAVTWAVHDRDVHSDEVDPARRAQEEADFLEAVQVGTYGPVQALEAIGGREVFTALIRNERPWEALTTARFERIDTLFTSLLREFGIRGTATLSSAGGQTTARVEWAGGEASEDGTPALSLVAEPDGYQIVLTEGRFVAAEGFVISPDGRIATPPGGPPPVTPVPHLSLTWRAGR
jgi:hypothetical protein